MKRCLITYKQISEGNFSKTGLNKLNPALNELKPFSLEQTEQIEQAQQQMANLSIPGVRPKLNAQLSIKDKTFKIVDKQGSFILKPSLQNYRQVPENEDLTMRLAKSIGIEVPLHGLIYAKDGSKLYFIKRFDRKGRFGKIHMEDFAQVAEMSRDTKYNYTIEKVIELVDEYSTFPMVEKMKLFKRILFNRIVGNGDMHLKNFSLIHRDQKIELSPAYNLMNTSIILTNPKEEMALSLKGKKYSFTRLDLFKYLGIEKMGLNEKILSTIEGEMRTAFPKWKNLVEISFMSEDRKKAYLNILIERFKLLA